MERFPVLDVLLPGAIVHPIRLDTAPIVRATTVLTLRWRVWRAKRALARQGATFVGTFGVEPNLRTPSIVYELNSAAGSYADRCLRAGGRAPTLRRLAAMWCGCDPALGAILVVGRAP
jgi:hypothetical protein